MKKLVLAAAAAVCFAGSANAAVLTLSSVTPNGMNNNTFTYQGTLGGDEGLRNGDRLVIFDFGGYIAGSVFSTSPLFTATTQLTSATAVVQPGFNDDAAISNLVFTYNGPDFRNTGGPFAPIDFNFGARSTFTATVLDAFFTQTTKNNPDGQPGGSNTPVFTLGSVAVPNAIPEPATWAMMIGGFAMIGAASRRRNRTAVTYA